MAEHEYIDARQHGAVILVHLMRPQLDESAVRAMSAEIESLLEREKCRKLIISLGRLKCVYSVLIARLIILHKHMEQLGGKLVLCDVAPDAHQVLASCQLHDFFTIAYDEKTALELHAD